MEKKKKWKQSVWDSVSRREQLKLSGYKNNTILNVFDAKEELKYHNIR